MAKRIGLSRAVRWTPVIVLAAVVFVGCPKKAEPPADETAVTSTSEVFKTAARNLQEPCNLPAEFGRCGCTLDGFRTPCDLVARCLELGFCEVVEAAGSGTRVTSESAVFKAAANTLLPVCQHPAEFGRCGCFLDGLQTSCDLVNRCLRNGFCVRVVTPG
jgi:hypothetical protein